MSLRYMAIDRNVGFHNGQSVVWSERGINSLRVDSMDEGIEIAKNEEFLFIVINSDNIDYSSKLALLRSTTGTHILIATSNYSAKRHAEALNNGADAFGLIDNDPKDNAGLVDAIIRKASGRLDKYPMEAVSYGKIKVLPELGRVLIRGLEVSLSKLEIRVLCLLINGNGNVFSREQIFKSIFDSEYNIDPEDTIKGIIKRIRLKTRDSSIIETVWGRGYRIGCSK